MSKLQVLKCKDCGWETDFPWFFVVRCRRCGGELEVKHTECIKCGEESDELTFIPGGNRWDHSKGGVAWDPPLWLCPKCNELLGRPAEAVPDCIDCDYYHTKGLDCPNCDT